MAMLGYAGSANFKYEYWFFVFNVHSATLEIAEKSSVSPSGNNAIGKWLNQEDIFV